MIEPEAWRKRAQTADGKWWLPWLGRQTTLQHFRALWSWSLTESEAVSSALIAMRDEIAVQNAEIATLRREMANAEDQAYQRAAEIVGLVKAEFASLQSRIDAAVQDKDAAVQAGVASALAEDSANDASRLNGLLDELATVLPAQVPDVEVPAPGEPAELPEGGTEGPDSAA